MCRLVAYLGKKILLSEILIKPKNSIIKQSLLARESTTLTNGDGFGLGWYIRQDETPALFTSLFPAWNDRNLSYLSTKIESSVFFAHVRAASTGGISQFNCHPFLFEHWMFMHNGWIPHFDKIKRQLQDLLDDDIFSWIKGSTDSELVFALFLQLAKKYDSPNFVDIVSTIQETFRIINSLVKKNTKKSSHLNICITDGKRLAATRYCSSKRVKPETMYLSLGKRVNPQKRQIILENKITAPYIVIASEKLSKSELEWQPIPANNCVIIESNLKLSFHALD
ncbi:class II glutamine amidotransferase [Legionella sp. 16cNR16C]|uniref:class II glutamine amidotransferase n=1 Tax=Legionella sp. 16cNR16C TaxID=2905656 RepID=UPI001E4B88D4|nr:class II glutamine amidotransferase [Legionella sp. 16cNR16C]MCE3045584.1 class II glutamine amidotransferase [Legionella sp. 16cNR16C]